MAVLCYRHNTVSASRLHMKNIAWHALICLPIETPLNRLQTSCGSSAVHRLGRRHLSAHASLYLFVGRQTGARVTLCRSQSLCVAARLQSQQKLLFHRTGLLARCVFLRLHICDAKRVSVHEDMELIFFGETSQHTWDNKCHLTSVMFVLIIVRLILELHDAAGSGFFLFWSSSNCTRSEIPET